MPSATGGLGPTDRRNERTKRKRLGFGEGRSNMNTTLVSSPFGSSSVQIGRTNIECGACAPNTHAARFAETVTQRPPAVSRSGRACGLPPCRSPRAPLQYPTLPTERSDSTLNGLYRVPRLDCSLKPEFRSSARVLDGSTGTSGWTTLCQHAMYSAKRQRYAPQQAGCRLNRSLTVRAHATCLPCLLHSSASRSAALCKSLDTRTGSTLRS